MIKNLESGIIHPKLFTVRMIRMVVCLLLLSLGAWAQQSGMEDPLVDIYGFHHELRSPGKMFFFTDTANSRDLSSIRHIPFTTSFNSFIHELNQNPYRYSFWLRFSLQNLSDSALDLYLYGGNLDYIDLYVISGDSIQQTISGGALVNTKNRSTFVEKTSSTLPFRLAPKQEVLLIEKIVQRTQEYDFSHIEIYDRDQLYASYATDYENNRYFIAFQLLFQGFLLCQLLYVLFQWVIIRRTEYLYYSCYLLLIALYFLSKYENVYGMYFLFSRYPLLKIYLNKTLIIFPYYFYFRFVRSFLEMPSHFPVLNKWIIRIEYFLLIYLAFDLVFILSTFDITLQRELYTYVLLIVFIISTSFIVYLFRKRQILIYYILSGSLFVGLGNILGLVLTYLDENEHIDLGFHNMLLFSQVGILLEIFCFTGGLSYKSKAAEKEKIKSQEKLIEQLKANEALQSKMQHIRNTIAQDLHDDIGSTLSSISILSNLAIKEKNASLTLETMNEINDSSINLMEKMDDIVWSINPRNDSLENLLLRIKRFATSLFEAKNIDYNIRIQDNINEVKLPMEYRQHIYLILKEAINNLVKYAEARQALIDVSYSGEMLTIQIRDDGKGFVMQEYFTGNGMLSMKNRAELMQAILVVDSKPNAGTQVTLKIKIK